MYLITKQDSSSFSPDFSWWYLRYSFSKTSPHLSFSPDSTTFYYLKLASHVALLGWSGTNDHCLRSSTFQRTMPFMHRWHFTLKANVNNVISPTQFGKFARNKLVNFLEQYLPYFFCPLQEIRSQNCVFRNKNFQYNYFWPSQKCFWSILHTVAKISIDKNWEIHCSF